MLKQLKSSENISYNILRINYRGTGAAGAVPASTMIVFSIGNSYNIIVLCTRPKNSSCF